MRPAVLVWIFAVAAAMGLGCGRSNIKSSLDRRSRSDADLVALLPRGLDAVLDVDIAGPTGLRQLRSLDELLALLPADALATLEQLCDHPTLQLESIAVGIAGLGTATPEIAIVVRGDLEKARIFATVRRRNPGPVHEVEYHGLPLIESSPLASRPEASAPASNTASPPASTPVASDPARSAAAAMLTARTAVLGSRLSTRQVVDIFRGEEEGARSQTDLMNALGRAPHAKTGRPAILLATLLSAPAREQIVTLGLPELATHAQFISAALAVGDGLDLGLVVGYRTLPATQDAVRALQQRTQELRRRPALVFVGIANFLEPLQAVAAPASATRPQPELHVAYRLPGDELTQMLTRLARLQQLRQRMDEPTPQSPAAH